MNPQPGILGQESSARNPQPKFLILQPGVLRQESLARVFGQESSNKSPQPGVLSQECCSHWPTEENCRLFAFFRSMEKLAPDGPKWGQEFFFPH